MLIFSGWKDLSPTPGVLVWIPVEGLGDGVDLVDESLDKARGWMTMGLKVRGWRTMQLVPSVMALDVCVLPSRDFTGDKCGILRNLALRF